MHKLLGLEQKMRQYEVGEQFVRAVVDLGGPGAVDRAWVSPDHLPTLAELDDPASWLAACRPTPRCELSISRRTSRGSSGSTTSSVRSWSGCSGGADSLALLALVRAAGFEACAVYVDHGLRARTFDHEVVEAAAARFGAGFRHERVEVGDGGNLEARARDARYEALARAAAGVGASIVAVGHTQDDQAETVLLNVLRGSATSGLAGMAAERGSVRRPLLGTPAVRHARDLRAAATRSGPRPDERRSAVPACVAAPRGDPATRTRRGGAISSRCSRVRPNCSATTTSTSTRSRPGWSIRGSPSMARASRPRRSPWPAGPCGCGWARHHRRSRSSTGCSRSRAANVRAVQLPGGGRVERVAGRLHRLGATVDTPDSAQWSLPGTAEFGPFVLDAWIDHGPPAAWPDGRAIAVFDADRVGPEVSVRSPHAGDRFHPIGRRTPLLVADALREAGVPASARAARPIVCTPLQKVCWVVGYRIDEHVKVTAHTRRFLWMSVETASSTASHRP